MMRVKKVLSKFCKLWQNILEKIGFRMMNLTMQEETILKRMMVEQETMRQSSVSFIITMDNTELEQRENLMKKIQRDQEILERLDEVDSTFYKLIFCKYVFFFVLISLQLLQPISTQLNFFQDDITGYCLLLWLMIWPILFFWENAGVFSFK